MIGQNEANRAYRTSPPPPPPLCRALPLIRGQPRPFLFQSCGRRQVSAEREMSQVLIGAGLPLLVPRPEGGRGGGRGVTWGFCCRRASLKAVSPFISPAAVYRADRQLSLSRGTTRARSDTVWHARHAGARQGTLGHAGANALSCT